MNVETKAQTFEEQRAQIRFVTRLEARVFPGADPCLIADISNRGARMQFPAPRDLPDRLVLVEWHAGRAYDCRVAWRRGHEAGVEFLDSCSLSRPCPPIFAEARSAWRKAADRPVTTFTVRQEDRRWVVTLSGPTVDTPAVVGTFLRRWEAQRFAREQAETFRGRAAHDAEDRRRRVAR